MVLTVVLETELEGEGQERQRNKAERWGTLQAGEWGKSDPLIECSFVPGLYLFDVLGTGVKQKQWKFATVWIPSPSP